MAMKNNLLKKKSNTAQKKGKLGKTPVHANPIIFSVTVSVESMLQK